MRHIISKTNKETNNAKFTNTGTIINHHYHDQKNKNKAGDTYCLWGGFKGRKEEGAAMEASAPARGARAQ
jgi:hypothetical protein